MTFEEWKEQCIKTFPGSPENVKKLEKFLSLFKFKERLIKTDVVDIQYPAINDPKMIPYQIFEVLEDTRNTQYVIKWTFRNTDMQVEMLNTHPGNIYIAINEAIQRQFQ